MEYYPFPALLTAGYNNTKEYGQGILVQTENAIDFISDFVPLLPLGTPATIHWVRGEHTVYSYSGRVYLSSAGLLRLVEVSAALLAPARTTLAVNSHIPGTVALVRRDSSTAPEKLQRHAVEILFLTNSVLKLHGSDYIPEGQQLLLSSEADFLPLTNLPLMVSERILLRRADALLICEVIEGNNENFVALSTYAARLTAAEEREKQRLEQP